MCIKKRINLLSQVQDWYYIQIDVTMALHSILSFVTLSNCCLSFHIVSPSICSKLSSRLMFSCFTCHFCILRVLHSPSPLSSLRPHKISVLAWLLANLKTRISKADFLGRLVLPQLKKIDATQSTSPLLALYYTKLTSVKIKNRILKI